MNRIKSTIVNTDFGTQSHVDVDLTDPDDLQLDFDLNTDDDELGNSVQRLIHEDTAIERTAELTNDTATDTATDIPNSTSTNLNELMNRLKSNPQTTDYDFDIIK